MPKFNFSNDLFLGLQELQKMQKLIMQSFKNLWLAELYTAGLIRRASTNLIENNFAVTNGTTLGSIAIAEKSYAINNLMQMIIQEVQDNILAVPSDSNWYWIKIAYQESAKEVGTVNIDSSGNLTGTNTLFLESLRGGSTFPTKIKFLNAVNNISEYEVVSVVDDTTAVLSGTFAIENNLTYTVVGTFTPGIVPTESEKYPFRYDSCLVSLIQEVVFNTPPVKVDGEEFYIARVSFNGATLTIQDKRTEMYARRTE